MRPMTADCPKILLPIAGKPFALHQIEWLSSQGVTEIVYCIGHLGDQIRALGTQYQGVNLRYSEEKERLGKLEAIQGALPLLRPWFLVVWGDSYLPDCNLRHLAYRFHFLGLNRLMATWQGVDYGVSVFRRSVFEHQEMAVKHGWHEIGSPEGFAELETLLQTKGSK